MNWADVIEGTRQLAEDRNFLDSRAASLRDRYHAFMVSVRNHLRWARYLDVPADKFKFSPEKSSEEKGFTFATTKESFTVPTEYLNDPDAWEDAYRREINTRIELIKNGVSEEFFNSLGEITTFTASADGIKFIVFQSKERHFSYRRLTTTRIVDPTTGLIYETQNATSFLFRNIRNGHATPANL